MKIHVTHSVGRGPTKLSAFDDALLSAGVANYNLIRLSSVIPPKSKIIEHRGVINENFGKWGDKLYVVMADQRVDIPNEEAWAGIGWIQDGKTGKGLFVEHEGHSKNTVERDIRDSLNKLVEGRKDVNFGEINVLLSGATCNGEPVCALAVAVYKSSGWTNYSD